MRAPRFLIPAVLLTHLLGCTSESRPAPQAAAVQGRLSDLERENRSLRSKLRQLVSTQDRTRWIPQRVQTLESKIAILEQRLSIVERR